MKNNVLKKIFSKNSITIYIVVAIYAIFSSLLYTDNLSRQLTNMLISVSCYIVLAVSLNLVVGFLGELSLGHACFMSVGLFTGCISSVLMSNVIPSVYIRLPIAMILGGLAAAADKTQLQQTAFRRRQQSGLLNSCGKGFSVGEQLLTGLDPLCGGGLVSQQGACGFHRVIGGQSAAQSHG